MINLALVRKQGITDDAAYRIMYLQQARDKIHTAMQMIGETGEKHILKEFATLLPAIESSLQKLWKFEQNPAYYKFWTVPHCLCPGADCEDNYPIGPYYVNLECPVHGGKECK